VTHDDVLERAIIHDQVIRGAVADGDECLYCGTADEYRHAEHCPFVTGLWRISDYGDGGSICTYECLGCGEEHTVRYACPRCDRYFDDDDCYRIVDEETELLVTYAVSPRSGVGICTDCAGKQSEALRKMLG
jgi:hypothetical protein